MDEAEIKKVVRDGYARIAVQEGSCCAPAPEKTSGCCGPESSAVTISKTIGYSDKDLNEVPEGANLGLGCGNPVALASLREGETVLDLGSGAGFDCFLAANQVGEHGKVIGIDMTAEMLEKARANAKKGNYSNVEFRLGEIENLPVADNEADIVISNCVINLSVDKKRVFREAYRALKPGGRMMVSDIVLTKELPDFIKNAAAAYVGCISGALLKDEYLNAIKEAGFDNVKIIEEASFSIDCMENDPAAQAINKSEQVTGEDIKAVENSVLSIRVYGVKPDETA